jgi:hypothetical protein
MDPVGNNHQLTHNWGVQLKSDQMEIASLQDLEAQIDLSELASATVLQGISASTTAAAAVAAAVSTTAAAGATTTAATGATTAAGTIPSGKHKVLDCSTVSGAEDAERHGIDCGNPKIFGGSTTKSEAKLGVLNCANPHDARIAAIHGVACGTAAPVPSEATSSARQILARAAGGSSSSAASSPSSSATVSTTNSNAGMVRITAYEHTQASNIVGSISHDTKIDTVTTQVVPVPPPVVIVPGKNMPPGSTIVVSAA